MVVGMGCVRWVVRGVCGGWWGSEGCVVGDWVVWGMGMGWWVMGWWRVWWLENGWGVG